MFYNVLLGTQVVVNTSVKNGPFALLSVNKCVILSITIVINVSQSCCQLYIINTFLNFPSGPCITRAELHAPVFVFWIWCDHL